MANQRQSLADRISSRNAVICIIGLGHVGMPEAMLFANSGFKVIGYDTNEAKVAVIDKGESHLADVRDEQLQHFLKEERFYADTSPDVLDLADVVIIAVPTLLTRHKDPEVTAVHQACDTLSRHIHEPKLVILESTGPPGVTEEIVQATLEREGLKLDRDFYLACSPARIDPGNKEWPLSSIPKIVGGLTPESGNLAEALYRQIMKKVLRASSVKAAEMTKLMENSFRAINIAFVDQMHMVCHSMGLNIWEIIDLAKTKPFGFVPFYPGPGPGGDCIPVDPLYVAWKAREHEFRARFIELAGETMDAIPGFFMKCLTNLLSDAGKPLRGARILIIGVAYKKDVADVSNSPVRALISQMKDRGAKITYHDPYVPQFSLNGWRLKSAPLTQELLRSQDVVMIVTNHSNVDYELIAKNSDLILDSRNAMGKYADAGFTNVHR